VQDVGLRGAVVDDDPDAVVGDGEVLLQQPADEHHVVDAAAQRRDVRALVPIDPDQDRSDHRDRFAAVQPANTLTT
jgi:hypothetical protein